MTRTKLLVNVIVVVLILAALLAAAVVNLDFHAFLKDFATVVVAIAAAYLTYCFQRRQAFLVSLRELWNKTIEAKADLIEYTHDANPDQVKFGKAHRSLSMAIDMMRAVCRNVHEHSSSVGLYPFEPMHDMRRALDKLGFTNVTPQKQKLAREEILQSWNAFRWSFLREFSAPKPRHHVTQRGALDPRRVSA
jgi:hypothetical protein